MVDEHGITLYGVDIDNDYCPTDQGVMACVRRAPNLLKKVEKAAELLGIELNDDDLNSDDLYKIAVEAGVPYGYDGLITEAMLEATGIRFVALGDPDGDTYYLGFPCCSYW